MKPPIWTLLLLRPNFIIQRIFVEDEKVGYFTNFDGPQVMLNAKRFSPHDGGSLERLHVGEPAHLQGPNLVVRANAFGLAVTSHGNMTAGVADSGIDAGGGKKLRIEEILTNGPDNSFIRF
jgi:hypothetical protein